MVYRTAPFSMTLNDLYLGFQGHAIFDDEYLRNGTTYRHSFNEILIGTYTRTTQQCRFERPWVTLSDLAKYSMTRSVARSLCDSWVSCFNGVTNWTELNFSVDSEPLRYFPGHAFQILLLMQGLGRFSCAWNVPYVTHHNFEVDYPPYWKNLVNTFVTRH